MKKLKTKTELLPNTYTISYKGGNDDSDEFVEIPAKYDNTTVTSLKWARQNLAISTSGYKFWKGGNTSAVKVPGTDKDVIVGDHFQWASHAG